MESWRKELYTNELYHHGIKGQQWGVRNGPPYPIEDNVLKRGTRLGSVSSYMFTDQYINKPGNLYTYNMNDEWDRKVYTGPYCANLRYSGAFYVREHEMEVVRDLTMPTKKERVDTFLDLYSKNKKDVIKEIDMVRNYIEKVPNVSTGNLTREQIRKLDPKHLDTRADQETAYELYMRTWGSRTKSKTRDKFTSMLSSKWDAMVDDNNVNIYNEAHDPVIVFKAKEVLKAVGNVPLSTAMHEGSESDRREAAKVVMNARISDESIAKTMQDVAEVMESHGKKVGL